MDIGKRLINSLYLLSVGHVQHKVVSVETPKLAQVAPPHIGEGLVQERERTLVPSPDVTEHTFHKVHVL